VNTIEGPIQNQTNSRKEFSRMPPRTHNDALADFINRFAKHSPMCCVNPDGTKNLNFFCNCGLIDAVAPILRLHEEELKAQYDDGYDTARHDYHYSIEED
jgi:hypothetical protein